MGLVSGIHHVISCVNIYEACTARVLDFRALLAIMTNDLLLGSYIVHLITQFLFNFNTYNDYYRVQTFSIDISDSAL